MMCSLKMVSPRPPSNIFERQRQRQITANGDGFPTFLPKEVKDIKDPFARTLAQRIVRIPVPLQMGNFRGCVMSSCIKPIVQLPDKSPVVLLHCFDSSCLEWRRAYPLLEQACLETWAIDVLGWGFSDLQKLPPCDAASKRHHLFELWKTYIKRPMILVGPSLGATVAVDFTATYPEAVDKLVLINANAYSEGTGALKDLPKSIAYAGVKLLKSFPLRFLANVLAFSSPLSENIDWTNIGRLHCQMPWWEDAMVSFMISGGYNVASHIKLINHKTLVICSENDQIVSNQLSVLSASQHSISRKWSLNSMDKLHVKRFCRYKLFLSLKLYSLPFEDNFKASDSRALLSFIVKGSAALMRSLSALLVTNIISLI